MFSKGYLTFYGSSDISFHYNINPRSQNYNRKGSRRNLTQQNAKKKKSPKEQITKIQ